MDKFTDRGHVPQFLLAFFTAVFAMPTDVYQVNYGEMGHEHAQPWRTRVTGAARRVGQVLMARLRALCSGWRGHPLAMPAATLAAFLLVAAVLPTDAAVVLATVGVPSAAEQLKPLRAQQAAIRQRAQELGAKLSKGETLTAEERTELAGLTERATDVATALDLATAANEAERNEPDPTPNADTTATADARARGGVPKVEMGQDRELDPKRPGLFGRQLQAVRNFYINGKVVGAEDQKYLAPMAAATGMTTDIGSDGGFLVAQERSNTVIQRVYETGQVASRVMRMPIGPGSNGMKLPAIDETSRANDSRYGGIVSGWLGQGNTLSSGKPKFREMDLKLRKVGAFVYATDEQLADSVALEGFINALLPKELTFRVEDAFVNGVGSNQPVGIMQSGALITVTRNTASRVLYEDVSAMWARMWAGSRKNAVWLVDQPVETQLEQLGIPIGTAGVLAPVYKAAGSTPGQEFATLYGKPIIPVEYCAALGTTGDIILASFDDYVAIDKGGVESAVSIHVAFLTDEQVFRFMYRVDGQPTWNDDLTPKNSGNTLSPYVVLS